MKSDKLINVDVYFFPLRGPRVCKLWSHLYASVETWQHRTLPVQCLRTVPQDERPEQTTHQTQTQAGESHPLQLHYSTKQVCVCVCELEVAVNKMSVRWREWGGGGTTMPGKLYFPNQFPGIVFLAHLLLLQLGLLAERDYLCRFCYHYYCYFWYCHW